MGKQALELLGRDGGGQHKQVGRRVFGGQAIVGNRICGHHGWSKRILKKVQNAGFCQGVLQC